MFWIYATGWGNLASTEVLVIDILYWMVQKGCNAGWFRSIPIWFWSESWALNRELGIAVEASCRLLYFISLGRDLAQVYCHFSQVKVAMLAVLLIKAIWIFIQFYYFCMCYDPWVLLATFPCSLSFPLWTRSTFPYNHISPIFHF